MEYLEKEAQMIKYLTKARELSKHFKAFKQTYVHREQNSRAYLVSNLTSTDKWRNNHTVIQETLVTPNIKEEEINAIEVP